MCNASNAYKCLQNTFPQAVMSLYYIAYPIQTQYSHFLMYFFFFFPPVITQPIPQPMPQVVLNVQTAPQICNPMGMPYGPCGGPMGPMAFGPISWSTGLFQCCEDIPICKPCRVLSDIGGVVLFGPSFFFGRVTQWEACRWISGC